MRPLRDPAPSRLAYRLNRLMLRPSFRVFLRYGLPVLAVVSVAGFWASDSARVTDAMDRFGEVRRQIEERPEFMVRMMSVGDVSPGVAGDIREVLSLDFPVSSFDLELDRLRTRVETLDAVEKASVRIRSGGVLDVEVVERTPAVIWRTDEALTLLDASGHRVAALGARTDRPDLPLLAGRSADAGVAEALTLFAAAEPIHGRLRGLLRVGERRWDIILDRNQRIMLPAEGAVTALEKAITLDAAQDLLDRDISAVDFRNPRRPVLRLGAEAAAGLYDSDFNPGDVTQ